MEILGLSFLQVFGRATPAIWAAVPAVIAVLLYLVLKRTANPNLRHLCWVPLGIGVILGIMSWGQSNDSIYMKYNQFGTVSALFMKLTLIVPIVVAAAIAFMDFRKFRNVDQTL